MNRARSIVLSARKRHRAFCANSNNTKRIKVGIAIAFISRLSQDDERHYQRLIFAVGWLFCASSLQTNKIYEFRCWLQSLNFFHLLIFGRFFKLLLKKIYQTLLAVVKNKNEVPSVNLNCDWKTFKLWKKSAQIIAEGNCYFFGYYFSRELVRQIWMKSTFFLNEINSCISIINTRFV